MDEKENSEVEETEEISVEGNDAIRIANEAVATYAGIAVSEVPGVYAMSGGFAGITEALKGKKNYTKGIKVDIDEKNAKIDANIIVEYGARIPDVAYEIQSRVKSSVENMTGLKVLEVNVHVQGVHTVNEKDNQEEKQDDEENKEDVEETNE